MRALIVPVLVLFALVCIVQAVVCAATLEATNAANWFGFGFVALAVATLRACLIDCTRGR